MRKIVYIIVMGDCYNIIEGNNKNTNIKALGRASILKVRSF